MLNNWNKRIYDFEHKKYTSTKITNIIYTTGSGDYVHSLLNYERALNRENGASTEHQQVCQAGIARSAIGSGDIRKGISLALNSNDPVLLKQCAGLLEDTKVTLSILSIARLKFETIYASLVLLGSG